MKKIILAASILLAINTQAQKDHTCGAAKRYNNHLEKSAGLTVAQIAETERYDQHFIFLDIAMNNTSTTVSGMAGLEATARENLDSALLELHPFLLITQIRVNNIPTPFSRVSNVVKVPVNVLQGQNFKIEVDYSGTPPTAGTNPFGGSGLTNASSPSWGNQVTWSLSESYSAYEWFPCKQSLKDKADSSSVKVTVPNACKAGSNGLLENVVDLGNGTTRYEWMNRHAIDYYLISVAVAQYVEYNVYANPTGAPNPILIQNYIYNNPQTLPYFQSDIDETVDFLELYSDLFGMYPFADEKYGHCMAPLSGGMEHQTMTTQGYFEKSLTAHELAHQWFGDNVTCASWTDIWVNEGFASYAEYIMLENLYAGNEVQDMQDRHDNIMSQPGGSVWVLDSLNEGAIFSSRLVYDKGAAIVHSMRFALNDDNAFYQGLQDYQNDFADSTAYATDIQNAWENASGVSLNNYFSEWYYGEGYPTYSAKWNTIGGNLIFQISQTVSKPSVTPMFTNDLEVKFTRNGAPDTIIRVAVNAMQNQYVIPGMGNVTSINKIDPNNWIINKVGTIQYDGALVSLDENLLANDFNIYPNPLNGENLQITVNDDQEYTVIIYATNGKQLLNQTFKNQVQLNFDYAQGSYILELKSKDGRIANRKLLKL